MAGIQHEVDQPRIGQIHDHAQFRLTLYERPAMGMERELDPLVRGASADLIEIPGEILCVLRAEVLRTDTPTQIHLEMFAAERGDIASAGAVTGDGLLNRGRIQILPAAADRAEREARLVEDPLQFL